MVIDNIKDDFLKVLVHAFERLALGLWQIDVQEGRRDGRRGAPPGEEARPAPGLLDANGGRDDAGRGDSIGEGREGHRSHADGIVEDFGRNQPAARAKAEFEKEDKPVEERHDRDHVRDVRAEARVKRERERDEKEKRRSPEGGREHERSTAETYVGARVISRERWVLSAPEALLEAPEASEASAAPKETVEEVAGEDRRRELHESKTEEDGVLHP